MFLLLQIVTTVFDLLLTLLKYFFLLFADDVAFIPDTLNCLQRQLTSVTHCNILNYCGDCHVQACIKRKISYSEMVIDCHKMTLFYSDEPKHVLNEIGIGGVDFTSKMSFCKMTDSLRFVLKFLIPLLCFNVKGLCLTNCFFKCLAVKSL